MWKLKPLQCHCPDSGISGVPPGCDVKDLAFCLCANSKHLPNNWHAIRCKNLIKEGLEALWYLSVTDFFKKCQMHPFCSWFSVNVLFNILALNCSKSVNSYLPKPVIKMGNGESGRYINLRMQPGNHLLAYLIFLTPPKKQTNKHWCCMWKTWEGASGRRRD